MAVYQAARGDFVCNKMSNDVFSWIYQTEKADVTLESLEKSICF